MKSSVIKQLLAGMAPLVLVFIIGWLGWEYLNGGFQQSNDPGLNTLYELRQAEPEWWTCWYPTAENRPISYHGRFSDYSPEGRAAHRKRLSEARNLTAAFRASTETAEVEKLLGLEWLDDRVAQAGFPLHEYELAVSHNLPLALQQFLVYVHPTQNEADIQMFMSRAETLPQIHKQLKTRLLAQAKAETLPHKEVLKRSAALFRTWASLPPDSQTLYLGLARKMARVADVELNEYVALDRLTAMSDLLNAQLKPGWVALANTLDSLANTSSSAIGVGSLPKGKAFYQQRLSHFSALGTNVDSLYTLAETWVEKWEGQRQSYLDSIGLSEAEIFARQTYWDLSADSAKTKFLAACRSQIREARPISYGLTDTLPRDRMDLWPSFLSQAPDYQYVAGSLDKKRRPRLILGMGPQNSWTEEERILTIYEQTIPGLHLLTHRQQKAGMRGDLRRTYIHPAIREGWAAYASYLLDHDLMAFPDPALRLTYFDRQRLRAVLFVLDMGIHQKGWTLEQALTYLQVHTSLRQADIQDHVWQVVEQPGKSAAAFTGLLHWLNLRQELNDTMGDTFYLNEYHNALLFEGPLSPPLIRTQMRKWSAPYAHKN